MLFSLMLLVLPLPSPLFGVLYLLCGLSDILDGFAARKLHTESETGAKLDSAADLLFALAYAVKILPCLQIPLWILVWTAVIAAGKITGMLLRRVKKHILFIEHSLMNKLTGLALFLLPLTVQFMNVRYSAAFVCILATLAVAEELHKI